MEVWKINWFRYLTASVILQATLLLTGVAGSSPCSPGYYPNGPECEPCPDGTYNTGRFTTCLPHSNCSALYNRMVLTVGDSMKDNVCGNCRLHYVDPELKAAHDFSKTICVPCEDATSEARALYSTELGWCKEMSAGSCHPGYNHNGTECEPCPDGTYNTGRFTTCLPHSNCSALYNRMVLTVGDSMKDNVCGNCRLHFVDAEGNNGNGSFTTTCVACYDANEVTRKRYSKEWCHSSVSKEKLQETELELHKCQHKVTALGAVLGVVIVCGLIGLIGVWPKLKAGSYDVSEKL